MNGNGSPLYNIVLLFLSIYVLSALVLESFFIRDSEIKQVLQYIDLGVCLFFLSDFFVNLYKAESKRQYMKWGWIDLVSSIPAIDALRWGRVSKIVRVLRYLRAIKSIRVLIHGLHSSKYETLTLCVFLVVFISFTLSSAFILDLERNHGSNIDTAESALWWAFLNIMNAKVATSIAISSEGVLIGLALNKIGLLLFAYMNSMFIAWLINQKRVESEKVSLLRQAEEA
jgi:voltage-gated potassium channel